MSRVNPDTALFASSNKRNNWQGPGESARERSGFKTGRKKLGVMTCLPMKSVNGPEDYLVFQTRSATGVDASERELLDELD